MGKALAVIHTETDRQRVLDWITRAPLESRVEMNGPRRTKSQNDRMWAMLTDIVAQKKTCQGRTFDTNQWKAMFMEALGHEQETLPRLNGNGFFAVETSTSKLSTSEMSDLIDFMFAWGAENDVIWSDPELRSLEESMRR